jgi:carbon-monoxide dehydrogenase small subunit
MSDRVELTFTVNGDVRTLTVHPFARLLDVLREDLRLTGTKEGCGEGECGVCSVLMDGRVVNSCLIPAAQAQGRVITTVEGLAVNGEPSVMQKAFLHHGGAQCGFCTPGMLVAATDLVGRCAHPDDATVREGLAGNLCRCTGYAKILDSVQAAAEEAP